ncbi:RDD family protein [Agromyces mangrovi Wang et al. 2018]|uniref:RDD family protein n=1 Tax=Agromyces mangrovi TaxID=1858653 RepID=UPI00257428C1|nr:RDD family protein [Agromyces mangrovi]BDZ65810.1 RDD family protein [Agromyces mangrovi]
MAAQPESDAPGGAFVVGEAVALDVRTASVFLRAAGAAIDVLVTLLAIALVFLAAVNVAPLQLDSALGQAVAVAILVTFLVIVPTVVETASSGRSLGKLAIGARVVRDDGGAVQARHAFVRALVGVLEIYLTFGGVALAVGFLNPHGKRLGDILAGTHAQAERVPHVPRVETGVPIELAEWAHTADVVRLPAPLARRIAQFLAQAPHLAPASRSRLAESLARDATPYVSPVPAVAPEALLAGIVAVRRHRDATALSLEAERMRALEPVLGARPAGFPIR